MASCLAAERRWVLTGTPSRHDHNDLRSLRSLLSFLKEPVFGAANEEAFATLITRCPAPWLARERLTLLLRRVMIRHTKVREERVNRDYIQYVYGNMLPKLVLSDALP